MWADILEVAGLIIAVIVLGVLAYIQWQKATPEQRADLLADEARRLVEWAEESFKGDAGATKYGKVLNRIMRRFPDVDLAVLEEHIQQAVLHMNTAKAARQSGRRQERPDA